MNKYIKSLILASSGNELVVQGEPFIIYRTGTQSSTTITLKKTGSPVVSGLYYRYGNSGNWIPLANSSGTLSTLTLNSTNGYEVQLYNTNDTFSTSNSNYLQFSFSGGNVGCKGNIQSLMNFSNECKPYCYYYLFFNCSSLTKAPELPATTLANYCYQNMFNGCTSLNYIKVGFTSWHSNATNNWVENVSEYGSFDAPIILPLEYGTNRIPEGWGVVDKGEPFTIYRTGTQSSTTITLKKTGSPVVSELYYRYGNSGSWIPLADSSGTLSTLTLNSTNGYEVQFYNANDTFSTDNSNYLQFSFSGGNVGCKGNIQSLMNFSNECKTYCYFRTFYNCSKLTVAPELPATTLAYCCYQYMFNGCSLTKAPELPATTLANYCYSGMFYGCSSLTEAPSILPATTLANYCYDFMFYGCTSLTKAPELPATTLAGTCYYCMFRNCSKLTVAPELPATTLAGNCYQQMFQNCTSLTEVPELPATTLAGSCYSGMFYGCTSLNYIKVGFTSWGSSNETNEWVSGVSSSGSFEAPASLPVEYGINRIPENWSLPGHTNIIFVNDQQCGSMPNQEFSYTIQYMLYPETLKPTFKITSGTLPDGVTLDENTGVISGLVASEMTTNLQITLSCEGCEDKVINFTISIKTTKWTENNLTSNTSNSDYEVSQRSTNGSYHAWYAMDGSATSYSKTQYAGGQYDWWMIDFKSPVLLKAVELKCDNEGSYGTYLEGSNDNSTWTRLDTTKFPDNATTLREYSLTTAYRYYRLISERQFYYIQFYEVRFKYSPSN